MRSPPTRYALAAVVVLLGAANLIPLWLPTGNGLGWGVILTVCLALLARAAGLTRAELGLSRATWMRGLRTGMVAAALVVPAYIALLAVAPVRRSLAAAGDRPASDVLLAALVIIPIATVVPEELAFRGVLWALLRRGHGVWGATILSGVLFGLWHVRPALGGGPANAAVAEAVGGGAAGLALRVAVTVVATTAAGVTFAVLRHRSGSLLPPLLLHWAVNGIGVVVVLLA